MDILYFSCHLWLHHPYGSDIYSALSVRRKLLSVLDTIEFSQDIPELLQLDFFERTQIEQVIANCEHVNEQGHTVCNVKVSLTYCVRIFFVFKKLLMCHALIFCFAQSCCIECWLLR